MRLVTLAQYRKLVYAEGSAPALKTLRLRIKDIPGGRLELGRFYVDLDEYDRIHHLRSGVMETRARLIKDPLLKGLI